MSESPVFVEDEERKKGHTVPMSSIPLASSTVRRNRPCNMFIDQLLELAVGRTFQSICPVCKYLIADHQNGASSSSPVKTKDGSKSKITPMKVDEIIHTYLDVFQTDLSADLVGEENWPRLLLKTTVDAAEKAWIKKYIVDPELDWEEARVLFLHHFESFSYLEQLKVDFHYIRQKEKETVQHFGSRFTDMSTQVNSTLTEVQLAEKFVQSLNPIWSAKLLEVSDLAKQITGKPLVFENLRDAVERVIEFETQKVTHAKRMASFHNNSDRGSSHSSQNSSSSPSYNTRFGSSKSNIYYNSSPTKSPKKFCVNHPNANNHTTAECRSPKVSSSNSGARLGSGGRNQVQSSPSSRASSSGSTSVPERKCYLCGSSDHLANDPRCPKRSIVQTRSAALRSTGSTQISDRPVNGGMSSGVGSRPSSAMTPTRPTMASGLEHKAADVISSSVEGTQYHHGMIVVNRTPPASSFITDALSTLVMVNFKGFLYGAYVDTGANASFVDADLVRELDLPIIPATSGSISLAHSEQSARRVGATDMEVTLLFPHSDKRAVDIKYEFEIMKMKSKSFDYHFTLGKDILFFLFPKGLPPQYYEPIRMTECSVLKPVLATVINNLNGKLSDSSTVVETRASSNNTNENDPKAHAIILTGIAESGNDEMHLGDLAASVSFSVKEVSLEEQALCRTVNSSAVMGLSDSVDIPLEFRIADLITEGTVGMLASHGSDSDVAPLIQTPTEVSEEYPLVELSTDPDIELEYARERKKLLEALKPLLDLNAGITGFCNLPESVVLLVVQPGSHIYRRQYPIAQTMKKATTEIIQRWMEEKKIGFAPPGCSNNTPITVVPKRDNNNEVVGYRPCLDVRLLNAVLIISDRFCIPFIRDQMEYLGSLGCVILSELDLKEAYLQLKLHESCRNLTAFTWENQQYVFHGCPFGLSFLTSHFQRLMVSIFHDFNFVVPYIDNIIFGSRNWEEHTEHFRLIVDRLNQVNLKLKMDFSKVGHSQLRCLGHVISAAGVSIDPIKIETILQWPIPTTPKGLQSFLGFCGFIRQHVRHYSELTSYLESIKNGSSFDPNDQQFINSFNILKHAVSKSPILSFPNYEKRFEIATDASQTGVGGVLFQPKELGEHITPNNIIAICSKKLDSSQQRWPTYRKELFGIVYSLRKFHTYIWGRMDLVVHTDHKPLTYMFSQTTLSLPLQYWLDVILEYHFEIRHRDGIMNILPDQLSRMFYSAYNSQERWGVKGTFPTATLDMSIAYLPKPTPRARSSAPPGRRGKGAVQTAEIRNKTVYITPSLDEIGLQCISLQDIVNRTVDITANTGTSDHPTSSTVNQVLDEAKQSSFDLAQFAIHESDAPITGHLPSGVDLAIELEKRGKKIPVSEKERKRLVDEAHLEGHFGLKEIYMKLWRQGFWWPDMRTQIDSCLKDCDACLQYTVVKHGFHPSGSVSAHGPGEHFQIDSIVGLPKSDEGYTAVLVCIDVYTGFIMLKPMESTTAAEVARNLLDIFSIIGFPKILQSDNGSEYVNAVIIAMTNLIGIEHRLISAYNPRADGKVERSIRTIKSIIMKQLKGTTRLWPYFLSFAQWCFNEKTSELTGSTPFQLMFGRVTNKLRDYSHMVNTAENISSVKEWKEFQERVVSLIYPAVSDRIKIGRVQMIERLNAHRRILLPSSLPSGTTVMIKDPMRKNKLEPPYIGPYIIHRRTRGGAYLLRDMTGDVLDRRVPPDQIKFVSRAPRSKDTNVHIVNYIVDHRRVSNGFEYLIDWKDWYEEDRTWEPERNVIDKALVTEYWEQQHQQQQQQSMRE